MTAKSKTPKDAAKEAGTGFWQKLGEQWKKVNQPWVWGAEPMELRQAILDEVEGEIVALGAGRRLFPHQELRIHLLAPDAREQTILRAVFEDGWNAEKEIVAHLKERDCQVGKLRAEIVYDTRKSRHYGDRRFYVEFAGSSPPAGATTPASALEASPAPAAASRPILQLETERGQTEHGTYTFDKGKRWTVGRLPLVLDEHGRARRKNDVAFLEDDDDSRSVSREHARIEYREATRGYYLVDERSAQGTRIFREGRAIEVASRNRDGLLLRDGDQLHFGRASMLCSLPAAE